MAVAIRHDAPSPAALHEETRARLTSAEVWRELDGASFAVVGYVTPGGEARSSGVVFKTSGTRLYTAVEPGSWKARHIGASHRVSVTVPVRRGGLLALAFPIPPATISFHARAVVHAPGTLDLGSLSSELEKLLPEERKRQATVIEMVPEGEFLTYGLGVSLMDMRKPALSRSKVPVFAEEDETPRAAAPGAPVYGLMAIALGLAVAGIWFLPAGFAAALVATTAGVLAWRTDIAHRGTRVAMFALGGFIALTAIPGGAGLLNGTVPVPLSWLAGTPFADYTIPGLALIGLCGGAATLATAFVFVRRRWAPALSVVAGVTMAGYEVVEILTIDARVTDGLAIAVAAQLLWLFAGVALAFLAARLLRIEGRTS